MVRVSWSYDISFRATKRLSLADLMEKSPQLSHQPLLHFVVSAMLIVLHVNNNGDSYSVCKIKSMGPAE